MREIPVNQIVQGDVLEVLKDWPDESIDCIITSPPYWGLRDYGVEGQLGLEKTPEEYTAKMVEIFREAKRVLKKEGTCWLNLGDSYATQHETGTTDKAKGWTSATGIGDRQREHARAGSGGLPSKNLVGIPWRVAFALQQPYYSGKIKDEKDRVWLAAMIDGEGCMFIHKRKTGQNNGQGYTRKHDSYGAGLEVANTKESIVKRCQEITGMGSICFQDKESKLKNRNQRLFRWNMRSNECRSIIQEIYPYLVGKKHEARLLLGCPSSGPEAEKAHESLIALHNGKEATIDFPAPKSLFEEGFYLRQDLIWSKPNCMPESVTDRCTKSHEYIFLLTKNSKYYFDNEAIREPNANPERTNYTPGSRTNGENKDRNDNDFAERERKKLRPHGVVRNRALAYNSKENAMRGVSGAIAESEHALPEPSSGRNKRSVWTISTKPYSEAHFATFPQDLIIPMVKAGCPEFVCKKCGKTRKKILEPSEEYKKLLNKSWTEDTDKSKKLRMKIGFKANTKKVSTTSDYRVVGYTDCHCKAGFESGIVLDPFCGTNTTGFVARSLGRRWIGIELNPAYIKLAENRLAQKVLL